MGEKFRDVVRGKPGIDGVKHRTHARHREIKFEVPLRIPRQRRHPRASLDRTACKKVGQPRRALQNLAISRNRDSGGVARGHGLGGIQCLDAFTDHVEGQRNALHQSGQHGFLRSIWEQNLTSPFCERNIFRRLFDFW